MSLQVTLRSAKNREVMAHAAENRAKAWEFRKMGASYEAIGKKLGVSHEAVRRYIQQSLDRLKADELKDAAEWRRLELARLDDLLIALPPRALRGELAVVDRVLRIQERRARLLGLDAPSKVALTDPSGEKAALSDAEVEAEILRLVGEVRAPEAPSKGPETTGCAPQEERPCPPKEGNPNG